MVPSPMRTRSLHLGLGNLLVCALCIWSTLPNTSIASTARSNRANKKAFESEDEEVVEIDDSEEEDGDELDQYERKRLEGNTTVRCISEVFFTSLTSMLRRSLAKSTMTVATMSAPLTCVLFLRSLAKVIRDRSFVTAKCATPR